MINASCSGFCGGIDFEAEVDVGVAGTATELKVEAVETLFYVGV